MTRMGLKWDVRWIAAVVVWVAGAAGASGQTITITAPLLPQGEATAPYTSLAFTASDSDAAATCCTWSASGLPATMSIDPGLGTISGTPTVAGQISFTVTATDTDNNTATTPTLTIDVIAGPAVSQASLQAGEQGVIYNQALTGVNGTAPYNLSLSSGSLPSGLGFSGGPTGSISGTPGPGTAGNYQITISVTDAAGGSGNQSYMLVVVPPPSINVITLAPGEVTVAYPNTSLTASGGTAPYQWFLVSGPTGLSIDPNSGLLSGTPTVSFNGNLVVRVADANSVTATANPPLTIASVPSISTASLPQGSLPQGEVGAAYPTSVLTVTGGTAPFTWSPISSSSIGGLAFSNGQFSGTPTSPVSNANITVRVTDGFNVTASLVLTLNIVTGPTITTGPLLPNGTINTPYIGATLAASGGIPGKSPSPAYTWSIIAGSLPVGLNLNPSADGTAAVVSGTPTVATTNDTFTVQVTDSNGITASKQFTMTIAGSLTIVTAPTLPNGAIGSAYSQTLTAAGGTPAYTWSITSGGLPGGMALSASGAISGTPTASGSFSFTVQVKDSANATATKTFTLAVASTLSITTAPKLANGTVSVGYSQALNATGGTPPYHWSVSSGGLPSGLVLDSGTGNIGGVPTTAGSFSFTVQVTDSASASAVKQFTLAVASGLTVTTPSTLPSGSAGVFYSASLTASGGTQPYRWAITSGALPNGVTLAAPTGVISGIPSAAGTFTFSATVTDNNSLSAGQSFTVTIASGLVIATPSQLPPGEVNTAYSQTLSATGGTPPYKLWLVSSGALPAGVTLDPNSGALKGTPTSAGNFSFTVQVTDNNGKTASKPFSLSIVTALSITTAPTLPPGTVGQAYSSGALTATGGTPPYTWTVVSGKIADGLALGPSDGSVTGTPTAAGTFTFTVQVTDAGGLNATQTFTIVVSLPAAPQLTLAGVPGSPAPAEQFNLALNIATAYPLDITGTITITFQPDAVAAADDPSIQFSPGGRTANFTIPKGSTAAVFAAPGNPTQIGLQTGTVSGSIALQFSVQAGGADLDVSGLNQTITIARAAPAIQSVKIVQSANGFQIQVTGYSTPRELTQAHVTFAAAAGANLQTTDVTESLSSVGSAWFTGSNSAQFGSQFILVLPFTASQGSVSAVASASVQLTNSTGTSGAVSAKF